MGENTNIEWVTHTFNPWRGCTKVSAGCKSCYAETLSNRNPRSLGVWGANGTRVVAAEAYWKQPAKWDAAAAVAGERHRVFCSSLADVFEAWPGNMKRGLIDPAVPNELAVLWHRDDIGFCDADKTTVGQVRGERLATMADVRRRVGKTIDATPNLDWLLVTKRPENIRAMWRELFGDDRPRGNVWLLTSVEDQAAADKRIPELLRCRDLVPVLGLSMEPLLEAVRIPGFNAKTAWCPQCAAIVPSTLSRFHEHSNASIADADRFDPLIHPASVYDMIHLVIVGGESGPKARPMHPEWARNLRDQCGAAGVPFFFKQWGEFLPCEAIPTSAWNGGREFFVCECGHWDKLNADRITKHVDGDSCLAGFATLLRVGKKGAGRLLDGREHNEMPTPAGVIL